MPLTAGLVISGISALGKIGGGISQTLKGNKMARNNIRPEFSIEDEYFDNRDIAARAAQGGLTDSAMEFYSNQAARGVGAGIGATLQGGGGVNAINGLLDTYQQGALALSAKDSELQNNNIRYFIDQNAQLAKQKVQKWVLNEYEPFKDKAAAASQMKAAGAQNISTGLGEGVAALSNFSQAGNYADLLKGVTGRGATPQTADLSREPTYTDLGRTTSYSDFQDPFEVNTPAPSELSTTLAMRYNGGSMTQAEIDEMLAMIEESNKPKY